MKLYTSQKSRVLKFSLIIILILIADYYTFEYGVYGLFTIFIFFVFKNQLRNLFLFQILNTIIGIFIYSFHSIQIISLTAILIIIILRKMDFKVNRFVNYLFYPLHLSAMYLISVF
ncbi:TraX family protein [Paenibacillus humicus]|uniref:TraX family protein n=1 Tax=Paenibacillus humicus TaxID=412861 RepID=UPI003D2964FA